jgi:hypothetical protein
MVWSMTGDAGEIPGSFSRAWEIPPGGSVDVAAWACDFQKPFWTDQFHVDGNERWIVLPDKTKIVESLVSSDADSYTYTATGVPGISDYAGSFAVTAEPDATVLLSWDTTFQAADEQSLEHMVSINSGGADAMGKAIEAEFPPPAPPPAQ